MTKKDILEMETTAYYSGFNGLEIKGIEYGIDDHVLYRFSVCWSLV